MFPNVSNVTLSNVKLIVKIVIVTVLYCMHIAHPKHSPPTWLPWRRYDTAGGGAGRSGAGTASVLRLS